MSSFVYSNFKVNLGKKLEALNSDTLKVALFTSSYSPAVDTDTTYAGLTGEVANGNGYTTGGATLSTVGWAKVLANSWTRTWAASTSYTLGQIIRPATGNGFLYLCVAAGTSGASAPTFGTTIGGLTTDNTVTWLCICSSLSQLTAGNVTWNVTAAITWRYAVLYDSTSGDLIAYYDPGSNQTGPSSGTININWDTAAGVFDLY